MFSYYCSRFPASVIDQISLYLDRLGNKFDCHPGWFNNSNPIKEVHQFLRYRYHVATKECIRLAHLTCISCGEFLAGVVPQRKDVVVTSCCRCEVHSSCFQANFEQSKLCVACRYVWAFHAFFVLKETKRIFCNTNYVYVC